MGSIKDRNGLDLTEAEDIKNFAELYKKDRHDPDNHDGVITHLQPDILECEVKWALRIITMNKGSGGEGIPVKLFQILMLKIPQAKLQQYMNHELPDVQAGFRKCRGTRDQLPMSIGLSKKPESSRKASMSA